MHVIVVIVGAILQTYVNASRITWKTQQEGEAYASVFIFSIQPTIRQITILRDQWIIWTTETN